MGGKGAMRNSKEISHPGGRGRDETDGCWGFAFAEREIPHIIYV